MIPKTRGTQVERRNNEHLKKKRGTEHRNIDILNIRILIIKTLSFRLHLHTILCLNVKYIYS